MALYKMKKKYTVPQSVMKRPIVFVYAKLEFNPIAQRPKKTDYFGLFRQDELIPCFPYSSCKRILHDLICIFARFHSYSSFLVQHYQ